MSESTTASLSIAFPNIERWNTFRTYDRKFQTDHLPDKCSKRLFPICRYPKSEHFNYWLIEVQIILHTAFGDGLINKALPRLDPLSPGSKSGGSFTRVAGSSQDGISNEMDLLIARRGLPTELADDLIHVANMTFVGEDSAHS